MKITLDVIHVRACQTVMGKNDVRFYFNYCYLSPLNMLVATDGHRIVRCAYATKTPDQVKEMPDNLRLFRFEGLKKSHKTIDLVVGENVAIAYDKKGVETPLKVVYEKEGRFPDFERVMPTAFVAVDEMGYSMAYLADISEIFGSMLSPFKSVRVRFGTSDARGQGQKMLVVTAGDTQDYSYSGLMYAVMPCRL